MPIARRSWRLGPIVFVTVILFTACGGDGVGDDEVDVSSTVSTAPTTTTTTLGPMTATPEASGEAQEGELTPDSLCAIDADSMGTIVGVSGIVGFVDEGPDGAFLGLEDQVCSSLIWIGQESMNAWTDGQRAMLAVGDPLTMGGVIGERDGEVVIEVTQPPEAGN